MRKRPWDDRTDFALCKVWIMMFQYTDLENLVEHEVALAKRHRRYLSLVFMEMKHSAVKIETFYDSCVRRSDIFCPINDYSGVVVLTETDRDEAAQAVHRYENWCRDFAAAELRTGMHHYPGENTEAPDLIEGARRAFLGAQPRRQALGA